MSEQTLTPGVLWAQRSSASDPEKNIILLTLMVPDVPKDSMKLDLQPTTLTFTGPSSSKKATYHVELSFFAEIDPAESKIHHSDRDVELVLRKKELREEYWPRLLKDPKKMHFLKTNFAKWVDEDEQEGALDDDDMAKMDMSGMGGMGGMGMGGMGMGGMGGDGGFPPIDFSKLGSGGLSPGDMGGDSDDDVEDEDEEMPALDGDEEAKGGAEPEGKDTPPAKIEEVE